MRRLIATLLLLIVPLQFAWSATENLHGHLDNKGPVLGFHSHDDDHHHHDDGAVDHDSFAASDTNDGHNDDGHHDGHYHPIFSTLLIESHLKLSEASPNGPPVRPPASFTSHIPPLFDWPPSALL